MIVRCCSLVLGGEPYCPLLPSRLTANACTVTSTGPAQVSPFRVSNKRHSREDRKQAHESFSHDPEVQVSTATAQGARRGPHQLRYSQSQNRPPHQVWAASLLRRHILERLLSVAMLEQSQDL